MMRSILFAAVAALMACSGPAPAGAQSGDAYTGAWAFQTDDYGNENFSVLMSGAALVTPGARNHYDVRLVANELITQPETGQSRLLTARETCDGLLDGAQFTITCRMAEPLEGYEPDNFVLQRGDADELVGVLSSATNGQVTFTRVR
jgi:hypothetical protein